MTAVNYVGRFAPSPTGALHFGSLLAALASFLDARANQGQWLLRIEDLDPAREQSGVKSDFPRVLEAFGLNWDGPVVLQSERLPLYEAALETLRSNHLTYPCSCSRKEIRLRTSSTLYDRHCLTHGPEASKPLGYRLISCAGGCCFNDRIQGTRCFDLQQDSGDYILKRRDGLFAYQLAVVVDDHLQGVTHVVRGCDLINETPRQIQLQHYLGYTTPDYAHIPVASNQAGQKLSKQTAATALDITRPAQQLVRALQHLDQSPPAELLTEEAATIIAWAIQHWCPENIRRVERKSVF